MPYRWFNEDSLIKFIKRIRERWPEAEVTRIEQHKSKQILYIRFRTGYVKLIINRDGGLRAYGAPSGIALAVKNIASRVLGLGEPRSTES